MVNNEFTTVFNPKKNGGITAPAFVVELVFVVFVLRLGDILEE